MLGEIIALVTEIQMHVFEKNVGELKSAFKKKKKKMSANLTSSSPPVKRKRSCPNTDLNGRRTTS